QSTRRSVMDSKSRRTLVYPHNPRIVVKVMGFVNNNLKGAFVLIKHPRRRHRQCLGGAGADGEGGGVGLGFDLRLKGDEVQIVARIEGAELNMALGCAQRGGGALDMPYLSRPYYSPRR